MAMARLHVICGTVCLSRIHFACNSCVTCTFSAVLPSTIKKTACAPVRCVSFVVVEGSVVV